MAQLLVDSSSNYHKLFEDILTGSGMSFLPFHSLLQKGATSTRNQKGPLINA